VSIRWMLGLFALILAGVLIFFFPTTANEGQVCVVEASAGDALRVIQAILSGIPTQFRDAISFRLTAATDCTYKIGVDRRITNSGNFRRLDQLVNSGSDVAITLRRPSDTFRSWVGTACGPKICLQDFREVFGGSQNYVSSAEGVLGQTLVPVRGPIQGGIIYSTKSCIEIFLASDEDASELSLTVWHEITHAERFAEGISWRHGTPEVERAIETAEAEARDLEAHKKLN